MFPNHISTADSESICRKAAKQPSQKFGVSFIEKRTLSTTNPKQHLKFFYQNQIMEKNLRKAYKTIAFFSQDISILALLNQFRHFYFFLLLLAPLMPTNIHCTPP